MGRVGLSFSIAHVIGHMSFFVQASVDSNHVENVRHIHYVGRLRMADILVLQVCNPHAASVTLIRAQSPFKVWQFLDPHHLTQAVGIASSGTEGAFP